MSRGGKSGLAPASRTNVEALDALCKKSVEPAAHRIRIARLEEAVEGHGTGGLPACNLEDGGGSLPQVRLGRMVTEVDKLRPLLSIEMDNPSTHRSLLIKIDRLHYSMAGVIGKAATASGGRRLARPRRRAGLKAPRSKEAKPLRGWVQGRTRAVWRRDRTSGCNAVADRIPPAHSQATVAGDSASRVSTCPPLIPPPG